MSEAPNNGLQADKSQLAFAAKLNRLGFTQGENSELVA